MNGMVVQRVSGTCQWHRGRGRCVPKDLSTMVGTYKPLNKLLSLLTNSLSNTNGLGLRRDLEPIQTTACLQCLVTAGLALRSCE